MFTRPSRDSIFGSNTQVISTQGYVGAIKDAYASALEGMGGAGWFGFSLDETVKVGPEILAPPSNIMVFSPLTNDRSFGVRWDRSPDLRVLGYSAYRSYNKIGQFDRLTDTTIENTQIIDANRDELFEIEKILMSSKRPGWEINIDGEYVISVENFPIAKAGSFGVDAQLPEDVIVEIDGVRITPSEVRGQLGEIVLNKSVHYDAFLTWIIVS